MNIKSIITCGSIPLVAILVLGMHALPEPATLLAAMKFFATLTWSVIGALLPFILAALILTIVYVARKGDGAITGPMRFLCAAISGLVAFFLALNMTTIILLIGVCIHGLYLYVNDARDKRHPLFVVPAALMIAIMYIGSQLHMEHRAAMAVANEMSDRASRAHLMSEEELAAFDAELVDLYISEETDKDKADMRTWALDMRIPELSPRQLERLKLTDPSGYVMIRLPNERGYLQCEKNADGTIRADFRKMIGAETGVFFMRLCALRHMEY